MNLIKNTTLSMSMLSAIAALSLSTTAHASKELAQKNACLACHSVDKKVIGPAYSAVAAKYKDQKDALTTLTKSIKAGGSGKWGAMVMPPQASLSNADASTLAAWILSGAK
jgi:cytochrome c